MIVIVVLAAAAIFAAGIHIKKSGPFNWADKKMLGIGICATIVLCVLMASASVPNNGLVVIWFIPALFVALMLISMSIEWPDKNWGDLIHGWTWGLPVDIADDDPRRTFGNPGYATKYDPHHADYDPDLCDGGRRYAIWGMWMALSFLFAATFTSWLVVSLKDVKAPYAAPAPSVTSPAAVPTTQAPAAQSPAPSIATLKIPCNQPKEPPLLQPYSNTGNLKPGGVEACTNGKWEPWKLGAMKVTVTHKVSDDTYTYYAFTLKGETVFVRFSR